MLKEYAGCIGKTGIIYAHGMNVQVTIVDVKQSYGRIRYLVTPVAGSGQVWTETVTFQG